MPDIVTATLPGQGAVGSDGYAGAEFRRLLKEFRMDIGGRVRALRQQKQLSQGDIEGRTGLFTCYLSRVENGHIVPSIRTLEKIARAMDIPMYQLFIGGEEKQNPGLRRIRKTAERKSHRVDNREERRFIRFRCLLSNMTNSDRKVLLTLAFALANRKK
jgi:transcriptional regulator with XRE-family HTH domain